MKSLFSVEKKGQISENTRSFIFEKSVKMADKNLLNEINKRRTFAIISHSIGIIGNEKRCHKVDI